MPGSRTALGYRVTAAVVFLALAGCGSAPPTVDVTSEPTFDGLYAVKNSQADQAWARPDIDISKYSKIRLQSAGIEYRPGGESGRTWTARSRGGPYEVTDEQKARFQAILREAFLGELALSQHFELVNESGPDVLLVRAAVLDVVSYVPPEPTAARSEIYLSEIGRATLVIELRDSITEAILARAVDRRRIEPPFGMQESTRTRNVAEVRRVANSWARMLRERLDEFGGPGE